MNNIITKQRNLMQQAMEYYNEIKIIERHFNKEEAIIQLKIELLEERYAETVTELAQLLMQTVQ